MMKPSDEQKLSRRKLLRAHTSAGRCGARAMAPAGTGNYKVLGEQAGELAAAGWALLLRRRRQWRRQWPRSPCREYASALNMAVRGQQS